jgi:hypothetical protein
MLQLRFITSQRGAVIICINNYKNNKDSNVRTGGS